jgi:FMN phosphatase YigB (HAD superfamily)
MKKKAVVFDLNKTLRKGSGEPRQHILKKAKKDKDKEAVLVISGETDKDRGEAREWLDEHHLKDAQLYMRPKGERAHDDVEKAKILDKVSRQFKIKKAYDDKPENVEMYREKGIKAKRV